MQALNSWTVSDCGAGVGRVTKGLLSDLFDEIDLVEPSEHLLDAARKSLKGRQHTPHHLVDCVLLALQLPEGLQAGEMCSPYVNA